MVDEAFLGCKYEIIDGKLTIFHLIKKAESNGRVAFHTEPLPGRIFGAFVFYPDMAPSGAELALWAIARPDRSGRHKVYELTKPIKKARDHQYHGLLIFLRF